MKECVTKGRRQPVGKWKRRDGKTQVRSRKFAHCKTGWGRKGTAAVICGGKKEKSAERANHPKGCLTMRMGNGEPSEKERKAEDNTEVGGVQGCQKEATAKVKIGKLSRWKGVDSRSGA